MTVKSGKRKVCRRCGASRPGSHMRKLDGLWLCMACYRNELETKRLMKNR